ncbi:hypothetical protein [Clostridium perfringens]|uniref:hypothetical protein n=1 Tax=Clostridium perfringens TaxID=1502 RepID=UPI0039E8EDF2
MEKREFKKAVTIFIDILGTRDKSEFDEWYNIASIFHDTVEREKKLDNSHTNAIYKREVHMFSDCAYIIYDYKDDIEEEKKDMNALMAIACYNTEKVLYEFLKNGFIARGALTYGDIYYEVDRNICFGPAMNRAYDLESHEAKVPRVIIDPQYVEELLKYNNENYRAIDKPKSSNGEIIKKDVDGFYYIHYLNTMSLGMRQMDDNEVIDKITKLCESEIAKKRETKELEESIKNKYDWLKNYINNSRYNGLRYGEFDINNPQMMKQRKETELRQVREYKRMLNIE